MRLRHIGLCSAVLITLLGCAPQSQRTTGDAIGRTYYIDGAGNWGYGVAEVAAGLRQAGYRGNVINYRWSPTFNPALDQTIGRPAARLKGKALGEEISQYQQQHPGSSVNLIALSAGTGVAIWACEAVTPPQTVQSLILLGSSIASDYEMEKALQNIGEVWVYYSRYDQILEGPVKTLGTIDGKVGVDSAGLVGLRYKGSGSEKIHNVGWSTKYERFGWTGAHTDATSEPFVRTVLARHIVSAEIPATQQAHLSIEMASFNTDLTIADDRGIPCRQ